MTGRLPSAGRARMPSAEIGDEGSGPALNFCLLRIIPSNQDEGLWGALLWVTDYASVIHSPTIDFPAYSTIFEEILENQKFSRSIYHVYVILETGKICTIYGERGDKSTLWNFSILLSSSVPFFFFFSFFFLQPNQQQTNRQTLHFSRPALFEPLQSL